MLLSSASIPAQNPLLTKAETGEDDTRRQTMAVEAKPRPKLRGIKGDFFEEEMAKISK